MLDYITINAEIELKDVKTIRTESKFSFIPRAAGEVFTKELQGAGIPQVSVWTSPVGLYMKSYDTINAAIRTQKFFANGAYDFSPVIGLIDSYLPLDKIGRLEWKLQSASFVYYFTGSRIKDYYDFLQKGRDLKNRHLMKCCETVKSPRGKMFRLSFSSIHKEGKKNSSTGIPRELLKDLNAEEQKAKRREERPIYDSIRLEFELSYDESSVHADEVDIAYTQKKIRSNYLCFNAKLKKAKIRPLCKKYGIQKRNLLQFQEKIFQIDEDVLADYIGEIAGTGQYYKFYEAEKIVQQSEQFKDGQKQKMCYALKGVAQYKGIDKFLNHAEDGNYAPAYEYMTSFKSRGAALEALRNFGKMGINPITLSVRRKDIASDSLANLIDVYCDAIRKGISSAVAVAVQSAQPQPVSEVVQQNMTDQAVPASVSLATPSVQQLSVHEEELINSEFQEEQDEWEYILPDDDEYIEKEVWYELPDDED